MEAWEIMNANDRINARVWFVYQCWTNDTLYKSGLTDTEAEEARLELDRIIEGGGVGKGCAVCGRIDDPSDFWVCKRLGLL